MQTIVIGHKNPDMDSICTAISYAELKRLNGQTDVIAARAGNTNERIDFVLGKFGIEPPVLINDLSPRVSDVMELRVSRDGIADKSERALKMSNRKDRPLFCALLMLYPAAPLLRCVKYYRLGWKSNCAKDAVYDDEAADPRTR